VLLGAYVLVGRGLGASGAFASVATAAVSTVAPQHASQSAYYSRYLNDGAGGPLTDWLVLEIIGVVIGGFVSAWLAGRLQRTVDRGAGVTISSRLAFAALGGGIMGFGAVFARGCTSGQALTGGALLSVGSWVFLLTAFGAGYLVTPLLKGLWR
jgi:uncharacterized membrane protein YedE/YeeE